MEQTAFIELANQVATEFTQRVQQEIFDGTDTPSWQNVKKLRENFGEAVLTPLLFFTSDDEVQAFREHGTIPEGSTRDGGILMGSLDLECFDEFCEWVGYSGQKEELRSLVKELIEETNHAWFQPFLTLVSMQHIKDSNGGGMSVFMPELIVWWEKEADVVPVKDLTKEAVLKAVQQKQARLLELNPRNPMQAGENINLWMEVAEELQLSVLINAETQEVLKHLDERHHDKVLCVPFGEAA